MTEGCGSWYRLINLWDSSRIIKQPKFTQWLNSNVQIGAGYCTENTNLRSRQNTVHVSEVAAVSSGSLLGAVYFGIGHGWLVVGALLTSGDSSASSSFFHRTSPTDSPFAATAACQALLVASLFSSFPCVLLERIRSWDSRCCWYSKLISFDIHFLSLTSYKIYKWIPHI